MPQIVNQHQTARPGAELRNFGWRKVTTIAGAPAGQPGEVVTATDTGLNHFWNSVTSSWVAISGSAAVISHTDSVAAPPTIGDRTAPAWPVPVAGTLTAVRVTVDAALAGGGLTVRTTRISPGAFTPTANIDVPLAVGAVSAVIVPAPTAVAAGDLIRSEVIALTATNVTAWSVQYVVTGS